MNNFTFNKISIDEVLDNVVKMLSYLLERCEISQIKISKLIGVSDKTIRNWLNGESTPKLYSYLSSFLILNINGNIFPDFLNTKTI